jgi:hypothetical protein
MGLRGNIMTERELIRDVRMEIVSIMCYCFSDSEKICLRCRLLKLIDDGLAAIGETNEE